ncbi:MAG: GNAT family N-acetyltransferase [Chloroflexota bacterium]|nr:GNAT family N-acetyltransferase [Chloroflexota bacterium]
MLVGTEYRSRAYAGDSDLQSIFELLDRCNIHDNLDESPSLAGLRLAIDYPQRDKANDLRLWEDAEGMLVAYGQVDLLNEGADTEGRFFFRVHPDARTGGLLAKSVISWAGERVGTVARERDQAGHLYSGIRDFNLEGIAVLEANGFAPDRYFFRMARDLSDPVPDPELPQGYALNHLQSKNELPERVACFNESFVDTWKFQPLTLAKAEHYRANNPAYKPEHDLVIVAPDSTFAAFCFCEIDPEDNARHGRKVGWIHLLGTRRGHRKIGLGRAMLLAGLQRMKLDGMEVTNLDVDADSPTGALKLYESAGFKKEMTTVVMRKDL